MSECLYYEENDYKLYNGKMQDILSNEIQNESIDCIITDPPYELNFMGKDWDNSGVAFSKETWEYCFKALKRGGYLLAFGGSRTFHRIACAIEDAGFEIRDCIMWLYGSGFPKSNDIGLKIDKKNGVESEVVGFGKSGCNSRAYQSEKTTTAGNYDMKKAQNEWGGWGTALKPAYEPILVARKPIEGSLVDNIIKCRVGGLNIDECRVENTNADNYDLEKRKVSKATGFNNDGRFLDKLHNYNAKHGVVDNGRFPANVITDGSEEVGEGIEEENAMRYFYCAKASTKDREEGLENFEAVQISDGSIRSNKETGRKFGANPIARRNIHPTVKPVELMQYLVRLVAPKGATILDCFMGSGSTGKAVMFENRERNANYKFIGIEMTEQYLPIAKSRIDYAKNKYIYEELKEKEERKSKGIPNIFDIMENEE